MYKHKTKQGMFCIRCNNLISFIIILLLLHIKYFIITVATMRSSLLSLIVCGIN